mgnify:CR=1 FL=1
MKNYIILGLAVLSLIFSSINFYFVYNTNQKRKLFLKQIKTQNKQTVKTKIDKNNTEEIIDNLRKEFDYKE